MRNKLAGILWLVFSFAVSAMLVPAAFAQYGPNSEHLLPSLDPRIAKITQRAVEVVGKPENFEVRAASPAAPIAEGAAPPPSTPIIAPATLFVNRTHFEIGDHMQVTLKFLTPSVKNLVIYPIRITPDGMGH